MDQNLLKKIAEKSRENIINLVTKKYSNLESIDSEFNQENLATSLFNILTSYFFLNKAGLFEIEKEGFPKEIRNTFFNNLNQLVSLNLLEESLLSPLSILLDSDSFKDDGIVSSLFKELENLDLSKNESTLAPAWLYQAFNKEHKDNIFRNLKKNIKITEETLTSATLIYTPEWIVKYLVENSLGRLWIKHLSLTNPEKSEKELVEEFGLKYYLLEEDDLSNKAQDYYKNLSLEDITFIDPAMGSGNILLYAFDLFLKFYISEGVDRNRAIKTILSKNVYGLDIDPEALRLTKIALIIKAETLDIQSDFNLFLFKEFKKLNLSEFPNAQNISAFDQIAYLPELANILNDFKDSKLLGSLINPVISDFSKIEALILDYINNPEVPAQDRKTLEDIYYLLKILNNKFDVVVTNPPYFGSKYLNKDLQKYIKDHYTYKHADLYSAFIEKALKITKKFGFTGLIVQPSFLTTTAFSDFRKDIIENNSILSLLDIGRGIFGYDFGSTAFIIRKGGEANYNGKYFKLRDRVFKYISPEIYEKIYLEAKDNPELRFIFDENYTHSDSQGNPVLFIKNQQSFLKFPKISIAYWTSDHFDSLINIQNSLGDTFEVRQGLATTDNNRFLRYWYEVDFEKIKFGIKSSKEALESGYKWFPYNKGGAYRKWYGNNEYIINWERDGEAIKESVMKKYPYLKNPGFVIKNSQFYFKPSVTWSLVASDEASFRIKEPGFLFDVGGMSIFSENSEDLYYLLGLSNSVVSRSFLEVINPTINYQCGDIAQIPYIPNSERNEIIKLVKENIDLTRSDWDEDELSWDFKKHPLIGKESSLDFAFNNYKNKKKEDFKRLQKNEEKLNELFINLYGLNELSNKVSDSKVSITLLQKEQVVIDLLSYFIGCLFGRYHLEGFKPLDLPVIVLSQDRLGELDIVSYLEDFLTAAFGKESLNRNLEFIAESLHGRKRSSNKDKIRNYFYKYFSKDHYKKYNKRPIYWEFGSGTTRIKLLCYYHKLNQKVLEETLEYTILNLKSHYNSKLLLLKEKPGKMALRELKEIEKILGDIKRLEQNLESLIKADIRLDQDDGIKINYEKVQKLSQEKKFPILKRI